jgi:hypothetical protein
MPACTLPSEPTALLDRRGCLRLGLLAGGLAWAGLGVAADPVLWLVSADQSGPYAEATSVLRDGLPGATLRGFGAAEALPVGRDAPPALVLTLGNAALRATLERASADPMLAQVPLLAGLLPRASFEALQRRGGPPVSGVWLDPAPERHLDLIRLALPERRRVGVLWGPGSRALRPALQKAAEERDLRLVSAELPALELFPALSQVLEQADVLLTLPDSLVYTPASLNNVLMAAYRQRVPVLGYAATHVRAGAVLALHTQPQQAGRQLAALARRVLQERRVPPPSPSTLWSVDSNEQVARSLGLSLPDATVLAQALQRLEKKP